MRRMPLCSASVANRFRRRVLRSLLRIAVATAAIAPTIVPHTAAAAPITWTGRGASDHWSDAGNWTPTSPGSGDDVSFSGTPPRAASTVDGSVRIGSLTFASTPTEFDIHIGGSGADRLVLTGAGVRNLSGAAGPSSQRLFADPGAVQDAFGGTLVFRNASGVNSGPAGSYQPVEINALGTTVPGTYGGRVMFRDSSSAGNATVNVGEFAYAYFFDRASAGSASINLLSSSGGTFGGQALFQGDSTAGNAGFNVAAGAGAGTNAGNVDFYDTANAGSARFTIAAPTSPGAGSGSVQFNNANSAADATFVVQGARVAAGSAATLSFAGSSDAGRANIVVEGDHVAATPLPTGGRAIPGAVLRFFAAASAGHSTIDLQGGTVAKAQGGAMTLQGMTETVRATAGNAVITVEGGAAAGALGATLTFGSFSTAGNATITNRGASTAGASGGTTSFTSDSSDAGSATFVNRGGSVAGAGGGTTTFGVTIGGPGSAANGIFENQAATAAGADGGTTVFTGPVGTALVHNRAATVTGAASGQTVFTDRAQGGSATLYADSGVGATQGGRILFNDNSNGVNARAILEAGSGAAAGSLDISGLFVPGMSLGSIEGGGIVYLGSKNLSLGGTGSVAAFSGSIRDGGVAGGSGGSLTVRGGTVTLSGANTYTGATRIGDLVTADSGKIVAANTGGSATGSGPVSIDRGGTLGGTGFVAGPVALRAGGTIAPGDAATLTLRDSLTWDGGGLIRLVLGAGLAESDHLDVQTLIRGANGSFVFDLVDAGVVHGRSYDLLDFDSLIGFTASDFTTSGLFGLFSVADGALLFRAGTGLAAVPEPGTLVLLVAGLVMVASAGRQSRRRRTSTDSSRGP